jgi:hypothetical protein
MRNCQFYKLHRRQLFCDIKQPRLFYSPGVKQPKPHPQKRNFGKKTTKKTPPRILKRAWMIHARFLIGVFLVVNNRYVESFENSSFTRPSGGVLEVKAQNMKNEKVVCGSLLEFQF